MSSNKSEAPEAAKPGTLIFKILKKEKRPELLLKARETAKDLTKCTIDEDGMVTLIGNLFPNKVLKFMHKYRKDVKLERSVEGEASGSTQGGES